MLVPVLQLAPLCVVICLSFLALPLVAQIVESPARFAPASGIMAWLLCTLVFVGLLLLTLIVVSPVSIPRLIGAPGLLFFAFGFLAAHRHFNLRHPSKVFRPTLVGFGSGSSISMV